MKGVDPGEVAEVMQVVAPRDPPPLRVPHQDPQWEVLGLGPEFLVLSATNHARLPPRQDHPWDYWPLHVSL